VEDRRERRAVSGEWREAVNAPIVRWVEERKEIRGDRKESSECRV